MFGSPLEQQILTLSRRRIHAQPHNILGTPLSPCSCCLLCIRWLRNQSVSQCSVTQLYVTLCDPLDCSPPDSSVHRIFQARILENCVATLSSRGSPWPKEWTWSKDWTWPKDWPKDWTLGQGESPTSPALVGRFLPLHHLGSNWEAHKDKNQLGITKMHCLIPFQLL